MLRLLVIFCALFAVSARAQQAPGFKGRKAQVRSVIKMLERGRYQKAIDAADQILSRHPRAAAARALKGIALARYGRLGDALRPLEASAGTTTYIELGGAGAHADALRAAGRGGEAWALRAGLLHPLRPQTFRIKTQCNGIDDLLSIGAVEEAARVGESMIVEAPDSPAAHAFLATALIDSGDVEEAEFHQWLAKRYSTRRISRIVVNEARLAMHYGDELAARRSWARARVMRKRDPQIAAWQAGWLRTQGEASHALATLQQPGFRDQQHPGLMLERVRLHASLGNAEQAATEQARLGRIFPGLLVSGGVEIPSTSE